ncbi:hypothetical protein MWU58_10795 [Flavobacteriaceae bacterium S0825]|uniref:hypothetical protein n=1 Tax=Gaetbulibacter sp. S0825 TaxID=2720084 RepID=UPI001431F892|nr:hypothetical protein [Gaetbulibacter sp. S0825]MCK0109785.1 hypothetical protein [Flavobacteriaceae bacterium S0825]NIX65417.1 hypothetical protein [Gaetbulibacter sp. S0825]
MSNSNKPGIAFWIIGIIALLWNGMGVNTYLQMAFKTEASTAGLNAEQIAMMNDTPAWLTALFAIAVFSGIIASILFLMRKKIAVTLFVISFVAATIQHLYWMFGTNASEVYADMQPYLMPTIVIVLGAFWVWFSKNQQAKGILA